MSNEAIPISWIEKWLPERGNLESSRATAALMLSDWRAEQARNAEAEHWAKRIWEIEMERGDWESWSQDFREVRTSFMRKFLAELRTAWDAEPKPDFAAIAREIGCAIFATNEVGERHTGKIESILRERLG